MFQERPTEKEDDDLKKDLTSLEKELLKSHDIVEIRGKRNRRVPVLIPDDARHVLELLSDKNVRISCNIDTNPYLFANSGKGVLRAYDSLELVIEEVKHLMRNPSAMKSTLLRKYIATVTQVLNITPNELHWVSDHLGHSLNIHKEYYRVMSSTIEKTKVAKLLILADKGDVVKFSGKKLEDISFEENTNSFIDQDAPCNGEHGQKKFSWTSDLNTEIQRVFGNQLKQLKIPKK